MHRTVVVLLVAIVMTAGCTRPSRPAGSANGTERSQTGVDEERGGDSGVDLGERYLDDKIGATVSYPTGWSRRSGDASPSGSYFDPEPIESIEPATGMVPRLAVHLTVEPKTLKDAADSVDERTVLAREPVTLGKREAVRFETQSAGVTGDVPTGVRSYAYYVELAEDRTLRAVTYQLSGLNYELNKQVLDAMVRSMEFEQKE